MTFRNQGGYQRSPGYFNPQCESPYKAPSRRLAALGYGNSMIPLPGRKRVRFAVPAQQQYTMSGALPFGGGGGGMRNDRFGNDGGRYERHMARYGRGNRHSPWI